MEEREEDPLEVKWGVTAEEAEAIAFLLGPVVPQTTRLQGFKLDRAGEQ